MKNAKSWEDWSRTFEEKIPSSVKAKFKKVISVLQLHQAKRRWFSGRMLACHAGGPGSIPGRRRIFFIFFPRIQYHRKKIVLHDRTHVFFVLIYQWGGKQTFFNMCFWKFRFWRHQWVKKTRRGRERERKHIITHHAKISSVLKSSNHVKSNQISTSLSLFLSSFFSHPLFLSFSLSLSSSVVHFLFFSFSFIIYLILTLSLFFDFLFSFWFYLFLFQISLSLSLIENHI